MAESVFYMKERQESPEKEAQQASNLNRCSLTLPRQKPRSAVQGQNPS